MKLTASKLRENIYRILDLVLKTGKAVEIERNGRLLKIIPVNPTSRLARLEPHENVINGDPEALVHVDWSKEWKGKFK